MAEGTFAKNTTIEIKNNMEELETWQVILSDVGVTKLHYRISDDIDAEQMKLLVKNASGNWEERTFVQEGSYIVFDFTDGKTEFSLVENTDSNTHNMILAAVAVGILLVVLLLVLTLRKENK